MSALARIISAAAIGGVVVGGAFGFLTADDPPAATLSLDAVPVFVCPGSTEIGTLYRGDRVLVTGRSGEWLAVRNVRGSSERVFVRAAQVVPDADLSGLPEVGCEDVGSFTVAVSEDPVPDTTTTTASGDSTTTSSSTSTTTSSTTTTTAPDTTPPALSNASASPGTIWELDGGLFGITCPAQNPRQSTISVTATDGGSGMSTVTATWTDQSGHATVMGVSGSTYSFTFGNYPADTWDPDQLSPFDHVVTVTLTARDNAGNASQTSVQVTVTEAGQCFG